jgi:ferrous iron transport protein A
MENNYLSGMKVGQQATIKSVNQYSTDDSIARRLRNLGFVEGEEVRLISYGPLGQDPLLVQIGFTRFALRSSEAQRVEIQF